MKTLYLQCSSGASGDMLLGALLDLGVSLDELKAELDKLGLDGEYELTAEKMVKNGVYGMDFDVHMQDHHHENDHNDHSHAHCRNLADILAIIDKSTLSPTVKELSGLIFQNLAKAEAAVHGTDVQGVHFHEVGAVDAIVDIVGVSICLDKLSPERIVVSPVNVGSGQVHCAHGVLPVPAPAVVKLMQGMPVFSGGEGKELLTPTGAAILSTVAQTHGEMPAMTIQRDGYGFGKRDISKLNALHAIMGDKDDMRSITNIVQLQAQVDDMTGEELGFLMERLFEAGALDVCYTPVYMKKNRPGISMQTLCYPAQQKRMTETMFQHSSTLGIRVQPISRMERERERIAVETAFGQVGGKRVGAEFIPEYEDCRQIAIQQGVALRTVYAQSIQAYYMNRTQE